MTKQTDLAWAAGFFDGEGCTTYTYYHSRKGKRISIELSIAQKDRRVLDKFKRIVGVGQINTWTDKTKRKYYYYTAHTLKAILVLKIIWKYLSNKKKEQAIPLLKEFRHKQLNPLSTGVKKSICHRGHRRIKSNLYFYKGYG